MLIKNIKSNLQKLGLKKEEADIYLALLEYGPMNLLQISKKTNYNRTTLYPYINNLLKISAISERTNKKQKIYSAQDPSFLQKLVYEKQESLNSIYDSLKDMAKYSDKEAIATIYKDKKAIENVLRQFKNTENNIYVISTSAALRKNYATLLERSKRNFIFSKSTTDFQDLQIEKTRIFIKKPEEEILIAIGDKAILIAKEAYILLIKSEFISSLIKASLDIY